MRNCTIVNIRQFILFVLCYVNFGYYAQILRLNEGDVCSSNSDVNTSVYTCQHIDNCNVVIKEIQKHIRPKLCSFNGSIPIVCCPSTDNKNANATTIPTGKSEPAVIVKAYTKADEMCREYSELIYTYEKIPSIESNSTSQYSKVKDCHFIQPYIVGGLTAHSKEYPHMVLLGYNEIVESNRWGCGGSLISSRWILSAAHCEKIGTMNYVIWAHLGDLNYLSDTDDARPKNYRIVQRIIYPNYEPPSVYNDIALFGLEKDVEFSAYIRPICLNTDQSLESFGAIVTGWGQVEFDKPTSADLLQVTLNIIPVYQCYSSYSSSIGRNLSRGIDDDSMICAGLMEGGKDTCGGDSGGPLQIDHPNYTCMHTQIGITSFGKFCGKQNSPGIYTKVSHYISWIESIVWPLSE